MTRVLVMPRMLFVSRTYAVLPMRLVARTYFVARMRAVTRMGAPTHMHIMIGV
ncbi:MAG: hypothetical protein ACREMQ_03055 [Longimicrobiales bacterium]